MSPGKMPGMENFNPLRDAIPVGEIRRALVIKLRMVRMLRKASHASFRARVRVSASRIAASIVDSVQWSIRFSRRSV